jgi:hypothetical protein
LGVLRIDLGITDQAREQIDALNLVLLRNGSRQFDDILGLTTSIRIAPKFEIVTTDETVDAEHEYIKTALGRHLSSSNG